MPHSIFNVQSIKFSKFIDNDKEQTPESLKRFNNDVGGSFFQYLTTDEVPIKVNDYLKGF